MTNTDPDDLERFVQAQAPVWDEVEAELASGRKRSHWMWFVFPQLRGLGHSTMATHYGLAGLEEARAYLAHPVLGPRLRRACELLLGQPAGSAEQILGAIDALKLRSCLTLFKQAAPMEPLFDQALQRFFGGSPDPLTLSLVNRQAAGSNST